MPSWKMPSICVDCSGESASVGSLFHQNQLSCCWAEAAPVNERTNTRASNRRRKVGIIGNLKEKRFFVEEYDGAHGCVSQAGPLLKIVTVRLLLRVTC